MLADPDLRNAVAGTGLEPVYLGPDAFQKKWLDEQEHYRKVVTDTGILAIVKSQTR